MAAVLFRMSWLDTFDVDTQTQPPHREFTEAEQGIGTGKRYAVVSSDGLGQAEGYCHVNGSELSIIQEKELCAISRRKSPSTR